MILDKTQHPCFNENARHTFGRIHLPIAPKCNMQCNYCDRKYDCINENRPGVTSTLMTPKQAVEYMHKMTETMPHLSVVGIAGPGEPFATPDETLETLRLVRADFPKMLLCVASNGLNVAPYVQELTTLNVTHITITVNAVNPKIGEGIYSWVRDDKKIYRGLAAAEVLLSRQLESLHLCRQKGLITKINSILIPGFNEFHIPQIAQTLASQGADLFNCIGMCHVPDTPFASISSPTKEAIEAVRKESECFIQQMRHCTRCRADAVGLLGENLFEKAMQTMQQIVSGVENTTDRYYAAVTTMEGFFINQHLGRACDFYIYGFENDKLKLIETRKAPPVGGGNERWKQLLYVLKDCQAIFTCQAGSTPLKILQNNGIKVIQTEGFIKQILKDFFEGKSLSPAHKSNACNSGCDKTDSCSGYNCKN